MKILKEILFWFPRLTSIIISFLVVAFLTEGTITTYGNEKTIATMIGFTVLAGIIYLTWHKNQIRLITYTPFAYLSGLIAYYFLGGFNSHLNFGQFIFLAILTGSVTFIGVYAWKNSLLGGALYIVLGALYFFLAYRRVETSALILVITILWITGITFYITPPYKKLKPVKHKAPPDERPNMPGWEELAKDQP